ncbi:MAG: CsbD family protein [Rhabdochlamydiaceae bacterium]
MVTKNMSSEEMEGKSRKEYGKAEEKIGKDLGDKSTEIQGKADKEFGKAEEKIGKKKEKEFGE